MPTTLIVFN